MTKLTFLGKNPNVNKLKNNTYQTFLNSQIIKTFTNTIKNEVQLDF